MNVIQTAIPDVMVIEPNSDTTTILLTGDKKNETLNPSIFAPNWPKNARKVQG